jgi:hypothetical protein
VDHDRWFGCAFLVVPVVLFWALLAFGPDSSTLSAGERVGLALMFGVIWPLGMLARTWR